MPEIPPKTLRKIAKAIGGNNPKLTDLGLELDFQPAEIKQFIATNKDGSEVTAEGTFDMLVKWREKTAVAKQEQLLRAALVEADLRVIAETDLSTDQPSILIDQDGKTIRFLRPSTSTEDDQGTDKVYELEAVIVSLHDELNSQAEEVQRKIYRALVELNKTCLFSEKWKLNQVLCLKLHDLFEENRAILQRIFSNSIHFVVSFRTSADESSFLKACEDGTLANKLKALLIVPELEEEVGIKLDISLTVKEALQGKKGIETKRYQSPKTTSSSQASASGYAESRLAGKLSVPGSRMMPSGSDSSNEASVSGNSGGMNVTLDHIDTLSDIFPHGQYHIFCYKLIGYDFNQAEGILVGQLKNYKLALQIVLNSWVTEKGGKRGDLEEALRKSKAGGLINKVFK